MAVGASLPKPSMLPVKLPFAEFPGGTKAAGVLGAMLANARATSAAVLFIVAVYVRPAKVIDWPVTSGSKVMAEDSVTPAHHP